MESFQPGPTTMSNRTAFGRKKMENKK